MHHSHGIGYEEYSRKLDSRLKVEQKRQQEYELSRQMISNIERKSFYHN
ncbi:hypothetical protein ACFSCX_14400 [Bacillus salitolerans]|uniref:YrzI family small protein n=1 Tax=Bacillus salitolerans TaxID=1437434 RepID=A0ABW4LST5_9BACI